MKCIIIHIINKIIYFNNVYMPRKGPKNPTKKSLKYTSNRYKTPEQKELSIQFKKGFNNTRYSGIR